MEDRGDSTCNFVISTEPSPHSKPIIFDPDFFVEKLRHEKPGVFLELVVSNLTRLIDLPGTEFAQLIGEEEPKLPTNHGFFRSFNFLKRKEKGVVFGAPLTEEGIAQVYQLIEYLYKRLMVFDTKGKRTVPDKERQIEALQLLFLLLPSVSRNLLKLLLDLLYHTAKQQDKNKMTASNLALMFAPQILWPKNMVVADLQENITKLNNGVSFMIKHSQKLFRAPAYIRELARLQFTGSRVAVSRDDLDLDLLPVSNCPDLLSVKVTKRTRLHSVLRREDTQQRTEEALKELFKHVSNMPDSAKKKKLVRQFNKSSAAGTPDGFASPRTKKHVRSRTFGGLIKRKVLGGQHAPDRTSQIPIVGAATLSCQHQAAQGKENLAQRPLELMSLHLSHNRSKSTDEILDEKESQRGNRMRQESAI
ncbi:rho GTPase-activating protein 19 isoform X2 [Leucoraja erinacea]|uniref:rho GTPase-activating protein 19 isoform X2 n=1 Tax=Leucoraja erinaceus TaxID=7782 RepID=UPI002456566A|nr:rho GTPase-activating protein 19 isoform X2 [Leucoraja erinacea]